MILSGGTHGASVALHDIAQYRTLSVPGPVPGRVAIWCFYYQIGKDLTVKILMIRVRCYN